MFGCRFTRYVHLCTSVKKKVRDFSLVDIGQRRTIGPIESNKRYFATRGAYTSLPPLGVK
jgi:hypothetical protein